MTRRASVKQVAPIRLDWKSSLERMLLGDKLLIHGLSQASVGSGLAKHNKAEKRFVSKKTSAGVYVVRIK